MFLKKNYYYFCSFTRNSFAWSSFMAKQAFFMKKKLHNQRENFFWIVITCICGYIMKKMRHLDFYNLYNNKWNYFLFKIFAINFILTLENLQFWNQKMLLTAICSVVWAIKLMIYIVDSHYNFCCNYFIFWVLILITFLWY